MPRLLSSSPSAALLSPPRGYRSLAWLGLLSNTLAIPITLSWILLDQQWRIAHIAIGTAAVVPTAIVGVVGSVALLQWRLWGQIVAIIALSMSLAVALPYSIVRLVMIPDGRLEWAIIAPLMWAANLAALVYWCRPAIRRYLR